MKYIKNTDLFLYPLKTSENLSFLFFLGGGGNKEREQCSEMGDLISKRLPTTKFHKIYVFLEANYVIYKCYVSRIFYCSPIYLLNDDTISFKKNYITFSFKGKNVQHSIICVHYKLKADDKFKKFYQKDSSKIFN